MGLWLLHATTLGIIYMIGLFHIIEGAGAIGVNYGMVADNLPAPNRVVTLYKSQGLKRLRLFSPDPAALKALQGSHIGVVLGTLNQDIPVLAVDPSAAVDWVNSNVLPHAASVKFRYISVGNEVIPSDLAVHVLPAIKNLVAALRSIGIRILVTTAVSVEILGVSYPPSNGSFSAASRAVMAPIVKYLSTRKTPLLVNVYPYFAYASNPTEVPLDYALFTAKSPVVQDGNLGYTNMFDAIIDSAYSAMERVGASDVAVVVSETGWPSAGERIGATARNARIYNNNVVSHVRDSKGTPKRPGKRLETYLFAMFNENLKSAGIEQNFGLYHPNMTKVYNVKF